MCRVNCVPIYEHEQPGTVMRLSLGVGIVWCAILIVAFPEQAIFLGLVLFVLLVCLFLFSTLKVDVTIERVKVSFGPGLIRKSIPTANIQDSRIVRNRWYYGWGIRRTPRGWMFNVSGFDAVELDLVNHKKFRIGTDDPQGLLGAIQQAMASEDEVTPKL